MFKNILNTKAPAESGASAKLATPRAWNAKKEEPGSMRNLYVVNGEEADRFGVVDCCV
jgi:hypothetical protein